MVQRKGDRSREAEWDSTSGRRLHRAGEHTAGAIAAQFRPATMLLPAATTDAAARAMPPPGHGRVDKYVLNVRPDVVDFRDTIYQPSLVELKTRLIPDPLERLGLEVREQGSEGSCTGQALATVIDLQNIVRWRDKAAVPARVSARMLYENARSFDEFADDLLPGSSARGAIKGFFHRGVCGAELAPYFPGDISWRLDVRRAKAARQVTLGAYFRLRHVLNDYHAALAEVRAVFCTAMVHDGWTRKAVRGKGGEIRSRGNDPKRAELTGAHAFAIVGYTPEGFIVLSSWGADWGGYVPQRPDGSPGAPLPGMALWPYDEWCEHVLDAWVLRLQVPASLPSGFAGGYHLVRRPTELREDPVRRPVTPASVPAMDVAGHIVNVADGVFVTAPPYNNDHGTFQETARFLRDNEAAPPGKRYDHLLFFAHGGLNEIEGAAARAAAMTPVFKQNGIYPIFFLWHTGFGETAADLLRRLFEGVTSRAGGFTEFSDTLLEEAARPLGRPVWREMKADARRCFGELGAGSGGDGWLATKALAEVALSRTEHPLRMHLVGHSAGAILFGEMLARAQRERHALAKSVATVSLLAPACSTEFFEANLAPVAASIHKTGSDRFAVYSLSDAAERDDSVAGFYRKSLLYLVSNAFEEARETPLLGMQAHQQAWRGVRFFIAGMQEGSGANAGSHSRTHGGFDNDPSTMNHVLARILGRRTMTERDGGFSEADLVGRGF